MLFLPASQPAGDRQGARKRGADLVILDLEDAVKPADKAAAREAAVDAVAEDWPMPVAIRINGVGAEWHAADLDRRRAFEGELSSFSRGDSAHRGVDLSRARPASRCWR